MDIPSGLARTRSGAITWRSCSKQGACRSLLVPALVSGAIVIETVFAYEGMGKAFYRALGGCLASASLLTQDPPPCPRIGYYPIDYPFALVLLVLMIGIVAASNIAADVMYAIADPRINYESDSKSR
jgi:peptide/nickel transport system permease protein